MLLPQLPVSALSILLRLTSTMFGWAFCLPNGLLVFATVAVHTHGPSNGKVRELHAARVLPKVIFSLSS